MKSLLIYSVLSALLATVPHLANSQTLDEQLRTCTIIKSEQERLKCFDKTSLIKLRELSSEIKFEGNSDGSTRPFRLTTPFEITWNSSSGINVTLRKADGIIVNTWSAGIGKAGGGKGSAFIPKAGEYFLEINSRGDWSVIIEEVKR